MDTRGWWYWGIAALWAGIACGDGGDGGGDGGGGNGGGGGGSWARGGCEVGAMLSECGGVSLGAGYVDQCVDAVEEVDSPECRQAYAELEACGEGKTCDDINGCVDENLSAASECFAGP